MKAKEKPNNGNLQLVTSDTNVLKPFFTAILPLPPSINSLYVPCPLSVVGRPSRGRRTRGLRLSSSDLRVLTEDEDDESGKATIVLSAEARAWKQEVLLRLPTLSQIDQDELDRLRLAFWGKRRVYIPLGCEIRAWLKNRWRRDIDNVFKITLDTVFTYLGLDDCLVCEPHAYKHQAGVIQPAMSISLWVLDEGVQSGGA